MPTENPPDDVLAMARTCARIMVERELLRAHRRLRREIRAASAEWGYGPGLDRAVLRTYFESFREALER